MHFGCQRKYKSQNTNAKYKYKYRYTIQSQNKRGGKGDGEQIVLDTFCLQEKGTKFKSNANDERLKN